MNRQQKESVIDVFRKSFLASKGSFFVNYGGLTVAQMQQLRTQLNKNGGTLKVAKMRLVRRALEGMNDCGLLASHCKNQVGVVFAHSEAEVAGVAKALNEFAKKNQSLSLVVGCVDAQLLDPKAIIRIASLPSKEVLLAQLCGILKAPLTKLVMVLQEVKKQKQEA